MPCLSHRETQIGGASIVTVAVVLTVQCSYQSGSRNLSMVVTTVVGVLGDDSWERRILEKHVLLSEVSPYPKCSSFVQKDFFLLVHNYQPP